NTTNTRAVAAATNQITTASRSTPLDITGPARRSGPTCFWTIPCIRSHLQQVLKFVCAAPEGQHNLAQRFSAGKRRVDESSGGTTPSHQSVPKVAILLPIHLTWLPFHLGFDTGLEVF